MGDLAWGEDFHLRGDRASDSFVVGVLVDDDEKVGVEVAHESEAFVGVDASKAPEGAHEDASGVGSGAFGRKGELVGAVGDVSHHVEAAGLEEVVDLLGRGFQHGWVVVDFRRGGIEGEFEINDGFDTDRPSRSTFWNRGLAHGFFGRGRQLRDGRRSGHRCRGGDGPGRETLFFLLVPTGGEVGHEFLRKETDVVVVGHDVADHGALGGLVVKEGPDGLGEAAKVHVVEVEAALSGNPKADTEKARGVPGDAMEGDSVVGSETGAQLGDGTAVEAFAAIKKRSGDARGEMKVAVGANEDEMLDFAQGRVGDALQAGFEVGDGVGVRVGGAEEQDALVLAGEEVELVRSVELGLDLGELVARNGECVVFDEWQG